MTDKDSDFTAWQNIKAIVSDKLLFWALLLLPPGSPESKELGAFVVVYMRRTIGRLNREG